MRKSISLMIAGVVILAGSSLFGQGKKGGAGGDAAKGKAVFDQNCAVCHNADSSEVKMGPGLKGLFKPGYKMKSGSAANDASVSAKIDAGSKSAYLPTKTFFCHRKGRRHRLSQDSLKRRKGTRCRVPFLSTCLESRLLLIARQFNRTFQNHVFGRLGFFRVRGRFVVSRIRNSRVGFHHHIIRRHAVILNRLAVR